MHNIWHICSTPITTEQYLSEQIKKGTGLCEDIFMKKIPVEHGRMVTPYTVDSQIHMAQNDRWEETIVINQMLIGRRKSKESNCVTSIQQSQWTDSRLTMSDEILDYVTGNDTPTNKRMKNT